MTRLGFAGSVLKVPPSGESDQLLTTPVFTFTVALKSRPSARVSDFVDSSGSVSGALAGGGEASARLVKSDLPTSVSLRPTSEPDPV